ncbi:hypothetical protein NliqN6_6073 [Naganishia liquefaciens]|uniref:Derlin n=1 Tax=Naganishia liquefaciens TaxID=104408 RepID=A0A8H3TY01_9TREE|nr:hypothetical protein NliqN6_6073 [Naganishia liquefaciens]
MDPQPRRENEQRQRQQAEIRIPGVEAWIRDIPPITRTWAFACVVVGIAIQCEFIAPVQLYFSWKTVIHDGQFWRIFTNFMYFGNFSFDLAYHLFFMMRYSRLLEENSYSNNRADYLCLMAFNAIILMALSPFLPFPFLSSSLAFSLVYIWARRNPHMRMNLFGVITVSAQYLPFCLIGFSWTMSGIKAETMGDAVGLVAGHLYYTIQDAWPREMTHPTGKPIIVAPRWLKRMFGELRT